MDDRNKLKICRKYIVCFALSTRLAVITLQFISNIVVIDHIPDVFESPKESVNLTLFDKITTTFLGGLLHWDAQYFYHISKYGYTFENTLAFFPLSPLLNSILSIPSSYVLPFLSWDSISLILFVVINVIFFVKSALALFDLSIIILSRRIAYRATILFCLNPATIFFVAPYTECMFSYFTFTAMLNCVEIYYKNSKNKTFSSFFSLLTISIPISLSIAVRSNGILNIGFLLYFWLLYFKKTYWPHNVATFINLIKHSFMLTINIAVCLLPFVLIQIFSFQQFCTNFESDLPKVIVNYANENDLVLPGTFSKHNQSWCFDTFPLAYSYVQKHYWNVGFLNYYEVKQIPNFLLALPIVFIILRKSITFTKQHSNYSLRLGFTEINVGSPKNEGGYVTFEQKMFVFIAHAFVLTVFCLLCVHVQVTTRMLCSASPIVYWFSAYVFENISTIETDIFPSWKGFLLHNDLNLEQKFIKYYFISYFIIGTVLFSNNFPWT